MEFIIKLDFFQTQTEMSKLSYLSTPRKTPYIYETVIDVIRRHAQLDPEKEIFIEHTLDGKRRVLTYTKLLNDAEKMARFLLSRGIKRGDNVGIFGVNSLELIIATVGVAMAGAVGINSLLEPDQPPSKYVRVARQAKCKALLLEPGLKGECADLISKMIAESDSNLDTFLTILLRPIEVISGKLLIDDALSFTDNSIELPKLNPEDVVIVFTTSGSTGPPKMAALTHFSLVNSYEDPGSPVIPNELHYNDRPFCNVGGAPFSTLVLGKRRVYSDAANTPTLNHTAAIWRIIQEERVTNTFLVLVSYFQFEDLLKNKDKYLNEWKPTVMIMAGQIVNEMQTKIARLFSSVVVVVYASTEALHISLGAILPNMEYMAGDVGVPNAGGEVKIVDETGVTVERGNSGQICTRSMYGFLGYLGDEEKTKSVKSADGWYRTGDVGRITEAGKLVIEGRYDDVINRNLVKINTGPLENYFTKMDGVRDAVVIGVPDKEMGEEMCLFYTCNDGSVVTEDDIKSYCRRGKFRFASLEEERLVPKYIICAEEMPFVRTGKYNRKEVRRLAKEHLKM